VGGLLLAAANAAIPDEVVGNALAHSITERHIGVNLGGIVCGSAQADNLFTIVEIKMHPLRVDFDADAIGMPCALFDTVA